MRGLVGGCVSYTAKLAMEELLYGRLRGGQFADGRSILILLASAHEVPQCVLSTTASHSAVCPLSPFDGRTCVHKLLHPSYILKRCIRGRQLTLAAQGARRVSPST